MLPDSSPLVAPDLLAFALRRATITLTLDLQDAMGSAGVRAGQFAVLDLLGQRPGLRQSLLGQTLGMQRNYLLPLLAELEDRGLLERRAESDRRAVALFLTDTGARLLAGFRKVFADHEARFAARLGPGGRDQLMALLARIGHRIADTGNAEAPT